MKKTQKKSPKKKKKTTTSKSKDEYYHLPVRTDLEMLDGAKDEIVEAWRTLKMVLLDIGADQKSHTSHKSVMFNREYCYAFARPKKSSIELNFFLREPLDSELIAKVEQRSKTKYAHIVKIIHEDQICEPLTDWLYEAYAQASKQSAKT